MSGGNYDYSQLHQIIERQYAKSKSDSNYKFGDFNIDNWFLEETFKFGKGYVKPSNYLSTVANKIIEKSRRLDSGEIDEPLYLHI